jgi:hypothetical protein
MLRVTGGAIELKRDAAQRHGGCANRVACDPTAGSRERLAQWDVLHRARSAMRGEVASVGMLLCEAREVRCGFGALAQQCSYGIEAGVRGRIVDVQDLRIVASP